MTTWFLPSWNGDFRLEGDHDGCVLRIVDATIGEEALLKNFFATAHKKKWTKEKWESLPVGRFHDFFMKGVPIHKVAPVLIKLTKPKHKTLSAVRFSGGRLLVEEGTSETALSVLAEAAADDPKAKGVTVTRPTPSCPQCIPGSIDRASEVLLSFLDDEEHADWAKHRQIVVYGGQSGHRYLLAHRHSRLAERLGRICYDLDDRCVVHFYDWAIPPEEEILAAKLILEHAEPWLRNEATLFHVRARNVYKNPFGGISDGVAETHLMQGAAGGMIGALFYLGTKNGVPQPTKTLVDGAYDAMAGSAVLPFGAVVAGVGPEGVPINTWGQPLY